MELEELKTIWQSVESKQAAQLRLNQQLLKTINFQQANRALRKPLVAERLTSISNFVLFGYMLAISSLIFNQYQYSIPGLVCAVCALLLMGFSIVRARILAKMDYYNSPVLTLQKQLYTLQQRRLQLAIPEVVLSVLALLSMWPIILFTGFEINIYRHNYWLILAVAVSSLVAIPIAIRVERNYRRSMQRASNLFQEIRDLEHEP